MSENSMDDLFEDLKKEIEYWQKKWLEAEAEIKRLKEVSENWRTMEQASSLMAEEMVKQTEKQRRHRKWALKKARHYTIHAQQLFMLVVRQNKDGG